MSSERPVITLGMLKAYLARFPDTATVVRTLGDHQQLGAYVALDVAMSHLEQEAELQ